MTEYIKKLETHFEKCSDGVAREYPPHPFELMQKINEVVDYLNSLISVGILPYPDGYSKNGKGDMTEDYQEKMDIGYMHEKSQFTEEKQCYSEKDRKYNF